MSNKKYYKVKAIPFIIKEVKDGKVVSKRYSMTDKETKEMSCDPRILWDRHDDVYDSTYFAELPLMYHGKDKLKDSLYYIYDELTDEEKEKYKDLVVEVPVTNPEVKNIYNVEEEKKNKIKTRKRKKDTK